MNIAFRRVVWAEDGMEVWILWDRDRGTALRCKVLVAAGNHARVVNDGQKVDRWMRLDDLRVPPDDPHGHPASVSHLFSV